MKRLVVVILIVAAIATVFVLTSGPPPPKANPPLTFAFAALGDAPYYRHEELQFRVVLEHMDAHDLSAVIHVGDIFWRPCSDAMYEKSRAFLESLRHPAIYTPGDNEWADCWEPRVGGYVPLERLARLRQIMFARPPKRLVLSRQPGYVENVRWTERGVVFATVHIIGSRNGRVAFPGRTAQDNVEAEQRTAAATAWLRETFAAAANAPAVVIAFHGVPPFILIDPEYMKAFQPFMTALREESARFRKPVLVVHGDGHDYAVDRPVASLPNLTRLEVPGSPDVGWVRVIVQPGSPAPFSFEKHVVPGWKYW